MKKLYFITLLSCMTGFAAKAQVGQGGFPLSQEVKQYVTVANDHVVLEKPDYASLSAQDALDAKTDKMYRVGVNVPANLDFHKTGSWTYLSDGSRIWKLSVEVPEAAAIALFYDKFSLPKGVKLFLTNANGRQVLGAYTNEQNTENGIFSNEPVQGNVVNIEMDIDAGVDVSQIQYRIKLAGALYRGLDWDVLGYELQVDPYNPPGVLGASASCHINAACPAADSYNNEKTSVSRILISPDTAWGSVGFCSGTLINSTRNSGTNCKPLFITASHCDGDNARTNEHFQYWQFRFNYKSTSCNGSGLPSATNSPTLTGGAKFVARSNYPSMAGSTDNPSLVQDFLLLELNDNYSAIPNAYLAGWNRKASYSAADMENEYNLFLGLHHPGGDMMKLTASTTVSGAGQFNQTVVQGTHWNINAQQGGSAPGSSGSALFDVHGRLMGVLSGGPPANCGADGKRFGQSSGYSKLNVGWENPYDQTNFPAFAGAQSRLKDALDPTGTNVMSLETVPVSACNNPVGIKGLGKLDNNVFQVYPSPSTNGQVNIKFNFSKKEDVSVTVYDVLGKVVSRNDIQNVTSSEYKLNLTNCANGVYMVNVTVGNEQLAKRIVLNK